MSTRSAFTLIELPAVRKRPRALRLRSGQAAFTLIELLVVITIIVVLLALLTPALDKAIDTATMAVCGSQLKTIATGATVYATGSKRAYPYRSVIKENTGQPDRLVVSWPLGGYDDRDMLDGYIGRETYFDPFSAKYDMNIVNTQTGDNVFVGYSIWWGFKYAGVSSKSMERIGQKFTWDVPMTTESYGFSILASDLDHVRRGNSGTTWTSHPDADGLLKETTMIGAPYAVGGITGRQFSSWWQSDGAIRRGTVDQHYAYTDGSVQRVDKIGWNEWEEYGRIVRVPEQSGLNSDNADQPEWHQLPRP